ncbi:heavy metal-associated isoprenylated plant protein 4 isoform X2 [Capsicum annuum]|uniref:heavy metal-associated isoprenylated plant protein 4 isoform X2 n=1 Tax=Capsicum annuum TaxID=4072 RepID=UPI001FB0DE77|nr:heavy metal-associated isoprenylated plant protein 4 isoform X2 [Capsicum annuum]
MLKCDNIMEGDPFKYKGNNTKAQLKGMTVLTSSAEVADEDEDLGGHNYVPSPSLASDHAGSSGIKTTTDASNDDDLRELVVVLEKSILDTASFVRDKRLRRIEKNNKKHQDEVHLGSPPRNRHQVNLEELAVVVIDIVVVDEKVEEEKKEEETKEEKTTDEQDTKKEEEENKKRTAEEEAENKEKPEEEEKPEGS